MFHRIACRPQAAASPRLHPGQVSEPQQRDDRAEEGLAFPMTSAEGREEVESGGQKVLRVGVRPALLGAPGYASGLEQGPAQVLLALPPERAAKTGRGGQGTWAHGRVRVRPARELLAHELPAHEQQVRELQGREELIRLPGVRSTQQGLQVVKQEVRQAM